MMTYLDWIDFVDEDKDDENDEPRLVVEGLERWTSGWGASNEDLELDWVSIDDERCGWLGCKIWTEREPGFEAGALTRCQCMSVR